MDIYNDLPPSPVASTSNASEEKKEGSAEGPNDLDQLVSNFGATLGSFWGTVRKQSQTAAAAAARELEALNQAAQKDFAKAREDFAPYIDKAREEVAPYMTKARAELEKLGEQAKNSAAAGQAAAIGETRAVAEGDAEPSSSDTPKAGDKPVSSPTLGGGEITFGIDGEIITSPVIGSGPSMLDETPPQLNALFNRMQALQSQIQANPRVAELSRNMPNLQQIQSQFSQLQAKLPDQVARSEAYLQRAGKELSDLLGNAVKVVPPTDAELAALHAGGKAHVLSRKEALLHRLRSEPAVMLVDPAQPPITAATTAAEGEAKPASDDFKASLDTREEYARFLQTIEDNGGLESEAWQKRISDELALPKGEGAALSKALAATVPDKIPAEAFWTRYFFRSHQIDQDEARRRQVLEGASQQADDDFKWDLEEEDPDSAKTTEAEPAADTQTAPVAASSSKVNSERNSSEDGNALSTSSYDMVSQKVSEDEKAKEATGAGSDEDSDWE